MAAIAENKKFDTKKLFKILQYSVSNQKHNSCKIYLKILQVVSKGRKISWLAGGVIGYNSERGNHLRSSPLKLTWPIGTRLWWNGPCVAPFQNHIR
jgi:hypothetical protein